MAPEMLLQNFARFLLIAASASIVAGNAPAQFTAGQSSAAQRTAAASHPEAKYDEGKVPAYALPASLTLQNGRPVTDAATWQNVRRPEVLRLFEENMYGRTPAAQRRRVRHEIRDVDEHALGGKATRKQVRIFFSRPQSVLPTRNGSTGSDSRLDLLIYLPNSVPAGARKPVPIFLVPSFSGTRPSIRILAFCWATFGLPIPRRRPIARSELSPRAGVPAQLPGASRRRWPAASDSLPFTTAMSSLTSTAASSTAFAPGVGSSPSPECG